MLKLRMRETMEYEKLVKFFVENELEFDGDEEVDTDILKCYEIVHGEEDHLLAAAVLAKRDNCYIIDGIAVEKAYRRLKAGKILLEKVVSVVKEMGGTEIYLVARAPEFFRKNGFVTINPTNAPNFYECKQCPQYGVSCHPEVMKLEIE